MNILIALGELAVIVAIEKRGYRKGEKAGYNRGFIEGQAGADRWWIERDFEVREAQVKMREDERWP